VPDLHHDDVDFDDLHDDVDHHFDLDDDVDDAGADDHHD
jgi:hypothetical protein